MQEWFADKDICIVGSAQSLFEKSQGALIDSHEVVCRLNRGVILKDTEHQGTRTDIWGVGVPNTVEDLFDTAEYKHNIRLSNKGRWWKEHGKRVYEKHPKIDFYLPLEILDQLKEEINHRKPSSGLMLLYYVLHCKPSRITLYGFDWKRTPTWYFTEADYRPHDWDMEEAYIRNLSEIVTVV